RAWALDPEVLFLDEPTAYLDLNATQAVENIVREIHDGGTTVIMTTQDLRQARRLANEIIFMYRGRVAEHAPAGKFFDKPASSDAQAFLDGELTW
ncbi:MAG: phosphate ABC transporter ATP-binding protein, partial [Proteobacteria bacterium]|nr:phosphate ABC transporter ATP-binding protein [Pseudomonadota bacterium]